MPDDSRDFVATPAHFGMDFETVEIVTKDKVKLHAYLIYAGVRSQKYDYYQWDSNSPNKPGSSSRLYTSAPTIVHFHGNAGNIGGCCELVRKWRTNEDLKACNFFLVEYRGYGKSQGKPNENGLYRDAKATLDYLDTREDIDKTKIILHGFSMGGGVAIHLASHKRYRKKVAGLILDNTFTSIPLMARKLLHPAVAILPLCCYSCKVRLTFNCMCV